MLYTDFCGLFIRIYTVIRLRRNAEMGFWARIELEVQWTCDLNVIIFFLFPCSMRPVLGGLADRGLFL